MRAGYAIRRDRCLSVPTQVQLPRQTQHPDAETTFSITFAKPSFRDCDYDTVKIIVTAIKGEC